MNKKNLTLLAWNIAYFTQKELKFIREGGNKAHTETCVNLKEKYMQQFKGLSLKYTLQQENCVVVEAARYIAFYIYHETLGLSLLDRAAETFSLAPITDRIGLYLPRTYSAYQPTRKKLILSPYL